MLALASLTACSKAIPGSEQNRTVLVSPIETKIAHPTLPAPVALHDIEWDVCGKKICTTPRHVELDLQSKLEVSRWMGAARDTIRYYRKELKLPEPASDKNK